MCGFLCVVSRGPIAETVDVERLDRDVLRHRGPDAAGELRFPHVFVRHWRLSIVDVTNHSNQPYGDGRSWLIYNGEIYNYAEIAARQAIDVPGDTPLVYELCQRGIDGAELERARGFYSYLYLREGATAISGARDPFGKKPLFYYIDDARGVAVFASEERAILGCVDARVDAPALGEYLLYKQLFDGRTFFRGIRQLPPGARFTFDVRDWRMTVDRDWASYYQMPARNVFALGDAGPVPTPDAAVGEALGESLALRVPREVPASIALSGGIDSALLARLAVDGSLLEHISAFITVAFEDPGCDESGRAAVIARSLGVGDRHTIVSFRQRDLLPLLRRCIEQASAPLEHPHYLSYFVLSAEAAATSKVLITGEGADELFMGYDHYQADGASFAFREYLSPEDEAQFTGASSGRPFDALRRDAAVVPLRERAVSSRRAAREAEIKSHLLTLLTRNDKMGMASSVEIRAPFLDREIVRLALSLDADALVDGGSTKAVLKRLFAATFAGIPLQPRKIGFRVPFDAVFEERRMHREIRDCCEKAAHVLRDGCGLTLTALDGVTPRLGWTLLNIGMFAEAYG